MLAQRARAHAITKTTVTVLPSGEGFAALDISENGVDFVGSSEQMEVYVTPAVADVFPTSVRTKGGDVITISGSNFK